MKQVERFEVKQFYRESIATAFQADKVRLAAAVVGGVIGYGLLRQIGVHRFISLPVGSAPVIIYAAYSLHRAQVSMGAAALVEGKARAEQLPAWIRADAVASSGEMTQTILSLLRSQIKVPTLAGKLFLGEEDSFRSRAAELLSLPEGEGQAVIDEWTGADLKLDEGAVRQVVGPEGRLVNLSLSPLAVQTLLKRYGWERSVPSSPYMSAVIAALRILRNYPNHLSILQHHLDRVYIDVINNEGLTLLRGGKTAAEFDQEARDAEVRAAIAPAYNYLQVCPGGEARMRTLTQETHLKIFTWVWINTNEQGKREIIQRIQCPLLARQELDALPRVASGELIERVEVIAFLGMKGSRRFISDEQRNLNFRLDQVALAGLILDTFGEKPVVRSQLPIRAQVLDAVSYWQGEPTSLLDQAIGLIKLGQPSE